MTTATADPTETISATLENFRRGIPGVYEGVPAPVYHALPAASSSVLKRIVTHSPAHAFDLMKNGMKSSDEMDIGSAVHCLMFTPSEFPNLFGVAEQCAAITGKGERCRSTGSILDWSGKWFCGTHKTQAVPTVTDTPLTVLSPDEMARTHGVVAGIKACERAVAILDEATDFELSVIVIDPDTKMLLKARLDILCRGAGVMPDLKTCRSSHPARFKYQARDYAYHVQLAFYRHVGQLADLPCDAPSIIASENNTPYVATVFEPSQMFMARGEEDMTNAKRILAECQQTGVWPAYTTTTQTLDLP